MGFVLSILYLVIYYLTPAVLFGRIVAAAHTEVILAASIFIISILPLLKSFMLKTVQTVALIGLAFTIILSLLFGLGWAGGAVSAFMSFIPNACGYFFVCLFCNSKRKMQVLVLMMLFVCLFVIAHGYYDLRVIAPGLNPTRSGIFMTQYLMVQSTASGVPLYRLAGPGEINDPNDFAQLIVCVIPLLFIFWRPKSLVRNIILVLPPIGVLCFGIYLTHSRGAVVALAAVALVAARRRIGTLPALLAAGGVFVAASALNFAGGRDISAASGSDRTALWGAGLQMLKAHPILGVGYERMGEYTSTFHTAHNSIVVCAAELGMVGLYLWSLFLLPTVRDALAIASPEKVSEGEPPVAEPGFYPQAPTKTEALDKAEINRLGRLLVLTLTGFMISAWFLSRAYVMTLFLLGGMVEVLYEMARQRGMIGPRLRLARVLPYSGVLAVSMVLVMYVMVLFLNRFS